MLRFACTSTVIPFAVRAISSPKIRFIAITNALRESPNSERHFSTDPGKLSGRKLVEALKSEIKAHELALAKSRGMPADLPFTVEDDPNYMHIMLKRDFGAEKIEVTVNPIHDILENDASTADVDDEKNAEKSVYINVSVSKENKGTLDFGAYVSADKIVMDKISFSEPHSYVATLRYHVKSEGNLQYSFRDFLKSKGIEQSKVGFLYNYMIEKRKSWGTIWTPSKKPDTDDLKKLKKFIEEW